MKLIDQESILRESLKIVISSERDVNCFTWKTNCEMANQEHLYYWKLLRLGLVKVIVLKQNLYFLYILMTKIAEKNNMTHLEAIILALIQVLPNSYQFPVLHI